MFNKFIFHNPAGPPPECAHESRMKVRTAYHPLHICAKVVPSPTGLGQCITQHEFPVTRHGTALEIVTYPDQIYTYCHFIYADVLLVV